MSHEEREDLPESPRLLPPETFLDPTTDFTGAQPDLPPKKKASPKKSEEKPPTTQPQSTRMLVTGGILPHGKDTRPAPTYDEIVKQHGFDPFAK